jgi:hypothetical protein
MLQLPTDWRKLTAGCLITGLLEQADAIGQYQRCSALLIRACMELLLDGWNRMGRAHRLSLKQDRDGLRLGDHVFHNCCRVDDRSLWTWQRLARRRRLVTILVPPWAHEVARRCVVEKPFRRIHVTSIDSYACLRVLWTSIDLKIDEAETFSMLLDWYTRLNPESTEGEIAIHVPPVN